MILNKDGSTLVSAIAGAGLLGVVTLGIMQVGEVGNKTQTGINQRQAVRYIEAEFRTLLEDPEICLSTLQNLDPTAGASVTNITTPTGTNMFSTGSNYINNNLELVSMDIQNFQNVKSPTDGVSDFVLLVRKQKDSLGGQQFARTIKIRTYLDGSNLIERCHAMSKVDNNASYWSQDTNLDLSYTDGRVLVGQTGRILGHPAIQALMTDANSIELSSPNAGSIKVAGHGDLSYQAGIMSLYHARGTIVSPAATQPDDNLGSLQFGGHNGNHYTKARARINAIANTDYTSYEGADLLFSTASNDTTASPAPTERMRISSEGDVFIGRSDKQSGHPAIQALMTDAVSLEISSPTAAGLKVTGHSNNTWGSGILSLFKARGTVESPTATRNGDTLGSVQFGGYNGSHFTKARARIQAIATTNYSSNEGADLIFSTAPNSHTANPAPLERMRIASNGNVTINGTLVHPSDRKLKTQIVNLDSQNMLDKILSLNGFSYEWKKNRGQKDIGLIAQEVNSVFPEIVIKNKETNILAIAYYKLISPIIESIKQLYSIQSEMKDQVEQLKIENEQLKQRLEILENKISN